MGILARSTPVIAFVILTSSCASAAPQALYGKSVVITWQEERQQKFPGEEQMRFVAAAAEFDVYVSEAGRPFSRLRFSIANRRGKLNTGTRDAVGEQAPARNIRFSGNSMNVSVQRGVGGAMLVSVTFDSGFQSCSARTISGKASGVEAARASVINGNTVDLYSVKTSGESCRIQNGNMFAN